MPGRITVFSTSISMQYQYDCYVRLGYGMDRQTDIGAKGGRAEEVEVWWSRSVVGGVELGHVATDPTSVKSGVNQIVSSVCVGGS